MVPESYKQAGLFNLVSGVLNIMTAGVWVLSLIWVCVGVLWFVPMAAGAYQAFVGYQMHQGQRRSDGKLAAIAGIVCGALNFNPLSLVAGVLAMVKVGEPASEQYLMAPAE